MRKKDVFGKKINTSKPLFNLIFVFVLAIVGFLGIRFYEDYKLSLLKEEQSQIEASISAQILLNQQTTYQEIDSLIPYLPNTYDEVIVYNEMMLIKNLSEINDESYQITMQSDAELPFSDTISENLKSTKLSVSFSVDNIDNFYTYLETLESMDRIYYVNDAIISFTTGTSATVSVNIYTFYMS